MPDKSWIDKEILPEATATPMTDLTPQAGLTDRMSGALASLYNSLVPRTPSDMVMEGSIGALGGAGIKAFKGAKKAWDAMDSAPTDLGRREVLGTMGKTGMGAGALGESVQQAKNYDEIADLRQIQNSDAAMAEALEEQADFLSPYEHAEVIRRFGGELDNARAARDRLSYNTGHREYYEADPIIGTDPWQSEAPEAVIKHSNPDISDLGQGAISEGYILPKDWDLRYPHEKLLDEITSRFGGGSK